MGIQVSKTQVSGGSFAIKPGDTFLYSVEDPRGRMLKNSAGADPNWLRAVTINPGDEGKKHIIYEGKVTNLVVRDGKIHYRYYFTKMWTTPDRFRNTGKDVNGPWSWSSYGAGSWYQEFYFGTENTPPRMLRVNPKGSDYPANHDNMKFHSLAAPQEISSADPNLAINGDFSRLSNQEIIDALNKYAMNASYTGRTSVPEVQTVAKEFLTMNKQQLEKTYKETENMLLNSLKGSIITITYKTEDGMPESETMDIGSFLDKGVVVLKDKDSRREYTGLVADNGADYDSIYQTEKDVITKHREELIGENKFGGEIIMQDIEFTGGNMSFPNPRTDIPFVNVKDPMDTDQILRDTGFAQIKKVLHNHPAIEGWTQVKELDMNGNPKVNTFFFNNVSMSDRVSHNETTSTSNKMYVSGLSRGAKRIDVVGSEDDKIGRSKYFSVRESRKEYPENTLKGMKMARTRILGMLHAYIQNNHSIRGTGGVLDMIYGGDDIASRMYLLTEALEAKRIALDKAVGSREKIFDNTKMVHEGFTSMTINERVKEDGEIDRLRTALEQNDAIVEQISDASTIATAQFMGAIFAAGAFFAISFYSLRK
jgi:hypothetical protein